MFIQDSASRIMGWVTLRTRQLGSFEPKGDPYPSRVGLNSPRTELHIRS